MAIDLSKITSRDVIEATNEEFISKYTGEATRFAEIISQFGVETVNAGTALYKYVVTGSLQDTVVKAGTTSYVKTTDKKVITGKVYYTESGGTYSEVESPTDANIGTYYEGYTSLGSSSGKTYIEGDYITRSHFTVDKVPVGEVVFWPYAFAVTAQAIQRGGLENAYLRVIDKARKQLRTDAVADMFTFLNNFVGSTTDPASGSTWNLQQMLAHCDEKLFNTMETANESDTDIIHFVNRSDAYDYLADATITMQDVFGLSYLENFLGVNNVFLTNKVTQGTVVATPRSNVHIYGIDFGTIASAGLAYATDDFGMAGIAYKEDYDHAGITVYPVRSMTIIPEVADFVVRSFAAHQV